MMEGMALVMPDSPSEQMIFVEGMIKMSVGMMVLTGMFVQVSGVLLAMAMAVFVGLEPRPLESVRGEQIAMMVLGIAFSISGAGGWSMDAMMLKRRSNLSKYKDTFLLLLRLAVGVYFVGVLLLVDDLVRQGVPDLSVFFGIGLEAAFGLLIFSGVAARHVMILALAWIGVELLVGSFILFVMEEFLGGVVVLTAAIVYMLLGPDRWTFFKDFTLSKKSS